MFQQTITYTTDQPKQKQSEVDCCIVSNAHNTVLGSKQKAMCAVGV